MAMVYSTGGQIRTVGARAVIKLALLMQLLLFTLYTNQPAILSSRTQILLIVQFQVADSSMLATLI